MIIAKCRYNTCYTGSVAIVKTAFCHIKRTTQSDILIHLDNSNVI